MTKPPAPYPAEPTHGSQIIASDRFRRIQRRHHLKELEKWSLAFLLAALAWAGVVLVVAFITGSIA